MSESETFVLPDIIDYCPFKFQVNPHHKIVEASANEWLKSYDNVNIEKVNKCQCDMIAAMAHGRVDVERLYTLTHYYQWVFAYDDFFDDGIWNKSPEDAKYIANITINILRNPETSEKTPFAPTEMLRSILLRVKKTATEGCQRRLIEHIQHYINAVVQQVLNRTKNIKLNIDDYMELRRQTALVPITFDMIEYSLDLDIPNEVMDNPIIQKLLLYCNDIIAWTNDLYSFNVEQSSGETHNLVSIAMTQGRSLQQSIDFVGDLIQQRVDTYLAEKDKIPSWNAKIDQEVATYFTSIEGWIISFIHWSFATERYFGKANQQVKKTRVVTMLPRKE